jgi:hypothetical protein
MEQQMKEIKLSTFEEFEEKVQEQFKQVQDKRNTKKGYFSPILFRGHGNASWKLETTLERYSSKEMSTNKYYDIMRAVRPAVESWTENNWQLDDEYRKKDDIPSPPQGYEFMVYLRHYGFPCPLLDWTRSPYIAAFFAFHHIKENEHEAAIYSLIEYCGQGKIGRGGDARITGCGPYLRTHKRHFIQQSQYTFCVKELSGGKYVYCSHEEVVGRDKYNQDVLVKYTIPWTERSKVLDKLLMMNITAHSLFSSEESLLSTLAYQEIERKLQ